MKENEAREAVLVRHLESSPQTAYWTDDDRHRVSDAASAAARSHEPFDAFVARRAALAVASLGENGSSLPSLAERLRWPGWLGPLIVLLALLAGLATDMVGIERRIHLLAPPWLGLLLWNAVVYLLLLVPLVSRGRRPFGAGVGLPGRMAARLARHLGDDGASAEQVRGFLDAWWQAARPLTAARSAAIMHAGAAALAIGLVGSLYWRGLALEYRAGWESTFLGAAQVQALLHWLLAPAQALLGWPAATLEQVSALNFAIGDGENAGRWIHLMALTLTMAVIVPRLLLAAWQAWKSRRLARHFPLPLDTPYFQSLRRMQAGEAARIDVWCYSYRPSEAAWHTLTRMLRRVYGPQALAERVAMLALGDEDDLPTAPAGQPTLLIVLFSLTATPEAEHHLRVIEQLQARQPAAGPIMALVDEQPFRERFVDQPERLEQRRQNWRRVLADTGIVTVFAPLSEAGEPALEGALKHLPGLNSARARSDATTRRPAPPDNLVAQQS